MQDITDGAGGTFAFVVSNIARYYVCSPIVWGGTPVRQSKLRDCVIIYYFSVFLFISLVRHLGSRYFFLFPQTESLDVPESE